MSITQLIESKILGSSFEETPIIIISGPTGVGKSNLALTLAKKTNGVIINADSMQIYKELKIISTSLDKNASIELLIIAPSNTSGAKWIEKSINTRLIISKGGI